MYKWWSTSFLRISWSNCKRCFLTGLDGILAMEDGFGLMPLDTYWYTTPNIGSFCCSIVMVVGGTISNTDVLWVHTSIGLSYWCYSSTLLIDCVSNLMSMGSHVPPKWGSIMSSSMEQDKPYEIATSASLSGQFSDEKSLFVGWQLKASAPLFDLPEWQQIWKLNRANSLTHLIWYASNLLSCT